MQVRARRADDLAACERLARAVHETDRYPPRLADDLRALFDSPDLLAAWVADVDGAVAGHVALHRRTAAEAMQVASRATGAPPERLAVVARLLVDPGRRRRGIGAALLETAADAAHARGLWPVLDVATHFAAAIGLYERSGWTRAGTVTVRVAGTAPLAEHVYVGLPPVPR